MNKKKDGYNGMLVVLIFHSTRSIPRAQTSAAPSLKSMKQSIQAWNNVEYCSLIPYPYTEKFTNVHPSVIPWCCEQTRTRCIQRVKPTFPYLFQIVPCNIADLSWKFHENSLFDFTVMLLTDPPQCLDGRPGNSLDRLNYFLRRP